MKQKPNRKQRTFEESLAFLIHYKNQHGDTLVAGSFITACGYHLGSWVSDMRTRYRRNTLSQRQIDRLNAVGFVWNALEYNRRRAIVHLLHYKRYYGDMLVPEAYQTACGFQLGRWVRARRAAYKNKKMAPEQIKRLNDIGFVWTVFDDRWQEGIDALAAYQQEHGNTLVPYGYRAPCGFELGRWIKRYRQSSAQDKLSKERKAKLDSLGFIWSAKDNFSQQGMNALYSYKQVYGNCDVPKKFISESGFELGRWVRGLRNKYSKQMLPSKRIKKSVS